MEQKAPVDYCHYIENENEALPATAIHRHAQAGYATTRLGAKLVPGITMDFDLSDPYFTEFKPGEYSSLHDPNLRNFLNKSSVRRCLTKNNLITKDGEVRCTLREFNRFQRNLKLYFKTQRRITSALEAKFYVDPRKVLRTKAKRAMLKNRIQHNVKIAEARARNTEFMIKRRRQILNRLLQKDRQMTELIDRVRFERDSAEGQAHIEQKRRELIKIRLDSTELIRRSSILKRIRHKERVFSHKQLFKKQVALKEMAKQSLDWHMQRMEAKDEELIRFLDDKNDKKAARQRSIRARTNQFEQNKNLTNERRNAVFEVHQRIEDTHLDEARAWERNLERKRAKASNRWRAKMHCMQTVAEGRMADIERRKCDRNKKAQARKKAQIEDNLELLEKMNVTVIGTTGYGSPELANVHRDNSRMKFSAYYDPGRDTIDPCRTTQFHANFKPLHVIQAKYLPGQAPVPPPKLPALQKRTIHRVPTVCEKTVETSTPEPESLSDCLFEQLLSEMMASELEGIVEECEQEIWAGDEAEQVMGSLVDQILDDAVSHEAKRVSKDLLDGLLDRVLDIAGGCEEVTHIASEDTYKTGGCEEVTHIASEDTYKTAVGARQVHSNFSFSSDASGQASSFDGWYQTETSLDYSEVTEDIVNKIMACFEGKHEEVYRGQTSTEDCRTRDGEAIVTDIIERLINTVRQFTRNSDYSTVSESVRSLLSYEISTNRDSLKDLHKRAQFLLNHALDVAQVRLKLRGYSYLSWNIMEDTLKKARNKIISENAHRVEEFSDEELVDWIMEEAKGFLQGATTILYETLHDRNKEQTSSSTISPENKQIVEDCYLDQLQRADLVEQSTSAHEMLLDETAKQGDIIKFAVLLVRKTLHNAMMSIPRKSSQLLSKALSEGKFDEAGPILAAKGVTVQHKDIQLRPDTTSETNLKEALISGDVEMAGSILANKALQQAMDVHPEYKEEDQIEQIIGSMILEEALKIGDLSVAGDIIIESALKDAIQYMNTPSTEVTLEQALTYGNLEIAGTIMTQDVLEDCLNILLVESHTDHSPAAETVVRRDSSLVLEKALDTGDLSTAGDIIVTRLLRTGVNEANEGAAENALRSDSSVILESSLLKGDLETAAPILVQRALVSGLSEAPEVEVTQVVPISSSAILEMALVTGNLEDAGEVIACRVLRSGMREVTPSPTKTESDILLEESLESSDLETAADVLIGRALRTPVDGIPLVEIPKTPSRSMSEPSPSSIAQIEETVTPAQSFEEMHVEQIESAAEVTLAPTYEEGIYFLEASRKTGLDEEAYDRGAIFVQDVISRLASFMDQTLGEDRTTGYGLLKPSLIKQDFDEAAKTLTKLMLDNIRFQTASCIEIKRHRTKLAALVCNLIFKSCLDILRGSPESDHVGISGVLNDHIRSTLVYANRHNGADAIVSIIIGKCISIIANTKTLKVRAESSIELFEACRAGDTSAAGDIIAQRAIKTAEKSFNEKSSDISKFSSRTEILQELPECESKTPSASLTPSSSLRKKSNTSVNSRKSKKKVNTEGLPMPGRSSSTSRNSLAKSSNSYAPVREMLMSQERELMVKTMIANSEIAFRQSRKSITHSAEEVADWCVNDMNSRQVGEKFIASGSDVSLPALGGSSTSIAPVRRVQSKAHVYYINEDGVIQKKAKKKRTSSRQRFSQEELQIESKESCPEAPKTVRSEPNIITPAPPSNIPSDSSRRSLERRRSSMKKNDSASSLQKLAVMNSSYSSMTTSHGSATPNNALTSNSGKICRPSIDEMLTDNDKELIKKLSIESKE